MAAEEKDDEARIQELRAKFLDGTYQLDAAKLSSKLVNDAVETARLEAELDALRKR